MKIKEIHGSARRDGRTRSVFSADGFTFSLNPDYGQFPANYDFVMFPSGCCDAEGNLYLTSRNLNCPVVMLDAEGRYVKDFGKGLFSETHGICVTPQNTLLCVDTGYHVIRELSCDGELIRDLGNFGCPSDSGFDPLIWRKLQRQGYAIPSDITFQDNYAWVFHMGLRSVKRAAPPFNRPTGVCVGPNGDIYVSDGYGNSSVHRFTYEGELLRTWGGPGDEPGHFLIPHSLWVDKLGRVWVGDREGNKINIYNAEGDLIACVTEGLYQPTAINSDDEFIYVAERGGGLTIFNMDMDIVCQLGFYNSPIRAHGMCTDGKGNLYLMPLTTYDRHYLMKLTREA